MGAAEGVRVEVHRHPGVDRALEDQRRAYQRRALRILYVSGPILLLGLVLRIAVLIRDARGDAAGSLGVVVFTLVLIAVITAWLMRRQKMRAYKVAGGRWHSRLASYIGPYDSADNGLPGSGDFARRHTRNTTAPIVLLVLTPASIEIVPTRGRNQPLHLDLTDVAAVTLTYGGRRERGVTVTTKAGRLATFLVRPDDRMAVELQRLGATVTGDYTPTATS